MLAIKPLHRKQRARLSHALLCLVVLAFLARAMAFVGSGSMAWASLPANAAAAAPIAMLCHTAETGARTLADQASAAAQPDRADHGDGDQALHVQHCPLCIAVFHAAPPLLRAWKLPPVAAPAQQHPRQSAEPLIIPIRSVPLGSRAPPRLA
ncbi:DUF2946 family protein [Sinimarinibacterium sp. NLF-5-8]|uniref:DUF2946 family protein n=1 Tax=Sinimarinibacterium sp. NLF-5-8 TaxID=2698684 RepID=UPI00137C1329|nr:DUF2946 family protein [Sinimarinibacterium sp. NLF-5-8]QHS10574.1 DUF2946 domain-containing protein [Sinimarinibacterium sp. NLF-5-8]